MKNKEAFDALVSKISVQENPSREDILQAISYLSDCEIAQVYAIVSGALHICPVCHGRGFLPGNFYELPGQSVSYAGYTNLSSSSVSCRSCQGKGFVE